MEPREVARAYAGGRILIGVLLVLFPRRVAKGLWGEAGASSPAVHYFGRLVGARDAILGAGALSALEADADGAAKGAAGRWMTYGAAADAVDALATVLAYRHLPPVKRLAVLLMAAGGASTGLYLRAALDRAD